MEVINEKITEKITEEEKKVKLRQCASLLAEFVECMLTMITIRMEKMEMNIVMMTCCCSCCVTSQKLTSEDQIAELAFIAEPRGMLVMI